MEDENKNEGKWYIIFNICVLFVFQINIQCIFRVILMFTCLFYAWSWYLF